MSARSPAIARPTVRGFSFGRLHRRCPELGYWLLVAAAWVALVAVPWSSPAGGHVHAGHHVAPETHSAEPAVLAATAWLLMVVAMMVPVALPALRHVAVNSLRRRQRRAMAIFASAYLAIWSLFGLAAGAALAVLDTWWGGADDERRAVLIAVLVVAAAFELAPAKLRALRRCRLTVALPPRGRAADLACLRAGLVHGRSCIGSCWALMAVSVVSSHAVVLMGAVTVIAWAQRLLVSGTRLAIPAAATLVAAAAVTAF